MEPNVEQVTEVTAGAPEVAAAAEGAQGAGLEAQPAAKEGAPTQEAQSDVAPAVEGQEGEPPAFTPRSKYKVLDKEHDVPKRFLDIMKDAETEKEVIDLLERASGLEPVKADRQRLRTERDEFKTKFETQSNAIDELRTAYSRGDIDQFLDLMKVPHERMLQWALEKVQYSQLPPEQQRIVDERREAQRAALLNEKQAGYYQTKLQEQAHSVKMQLLDSGLARPDIKTFAEQFDALRGQPGAFKSEVIAEGELAWIQSQGAQDLTPEQAIEKVMSKWGKFIQPNTQQSGTTQVPAAGGAQAGPAVMANPHAKAIPNLSGKSQSPLKSKPKSVEDLKKLRDHAHG